MDDLRKQQEKELAFYHFTRGETVASIGAQCCHWEAAYAAASDSIHIYLEDIDSSWMNARQAGFAWNYYAGLLGHPLPASFQLVLGEEKKTNLPNGIFDKILIINSFHEFTYKKEMLRDIALKLKPGGTLFIDETLALRSGELHGVCHRQMYMDNELIELLRQYGYDYTGGVVLNYHKQKPVRKLFAFKLSQPVPVKNG